MIETNQPHLDLGEIKLGTDYFFQVNVMNTYGEPKFVIPQMSCGSCTFFVSGPDFVAPSGEGTFKFRFNPTAPGPQIKSIFFNIEGKKEAEFLFKANVVS